MSSLITVSFDTAPNYKTVYASTLHISPADKDLLLHLARSIGVHFVHATSQTADTGIILRMVAIGSSDEWEDVAVSLADDGFTPDFVYMIGEIVAAGFDAVHFDHDFDLIDTLKWYIDGVTVIPVAYQARLLSFDELTDEQKEKAREDVEEDLLQDTTFMPLGDILFNETDFSAIISGWNQYGFTHGYHESAFSNLLVSRNDDDSFEVIRVVSEG